MLPSRFVNRSAAALVAFSLVACEAPTGGAPSLLTALPRALTADELAIIDANNAFAFRLFKEVARSDSNHLISPLSASYALGMAANGADAETLDGILQALSLDGLSVPQANAGYKSLTALLTSLDNRTEMRIANSAWFNDRFTPAAPFSATLEQHFAARVQSLDFMNPQSPTTINDWVKAETRGRIPSIVGTLSDDMALILANAVFFKGTWRNQFDPDKTTTRPFTGSGGTTAVPMMQRLGAARYAESATHRMLDLPYGNGAFAMTLVMPAQPDQPLQALVDSLSPERWAQWTSALSEAPEVSILLPRFTLDYMRELKDDLSALGMSRAFSREAQFPHIIEDPEQLAIWSVLQKSRLEVNESGTVAAAATTITMGVTSISNPMFHADRPFLVVLRERLSGTILFVGKVVRM